jgi:cell division transport system permease protein
MTDAGAHAEEIHERAAPTRLSAGPESRVETPIVPKSTIAGSALTSVVAIMTFLAALTTGAVMMMRAAALDWQSDVAREVTIQVRPVAGRDIEADVTKASGIARAMTGIADVRPYSKDESAALLQPWLGTGLTLDELPIPRIIVVRVTSGAKPDLPQLRQTLSAQVPPASLDDHRGFVERMRSMAQLAVTAGLGVLILVVVATTLSVTFATRGAMATNRPVIEVLHFIGAKDNFIAGHFQRHFLVLGFKGGALGGLAAVALFAFLDGLHRWFPGTGSEEFGALFGTFSIGIAGYITMLCQIVLIALVTAAASRYTVNRTLASIQ